MQIPIIDGIYVDNVGNFRTSYPKNLIPIPKQNGVSQGFLKLSNGIEKWGDGPGIDRGGFVYNDVCYRVMGSSLVKISPTGVITRIGDMPGSGRVNFDYSFDYLAINSDDKLYLYNGSTIQQVTDVDLGKVLDVIYLDGYFITTDGDYIVITELNDPFSVNPLKYGSSEIKPDPIIGLLKIQNELIAVNRYSIEMFNNTGKSLFPFQRVDGAVIDKGAIGPDAYCVFNNMIAFVGSGENEPLGIYLGLNSQAEKISTLEIDKIINSFSINDLKNIHIETQIDNMHNNLLIHLKDRTVVYDFNASIEMQRPIWYYLSSSITDFSTYRARNFTYCYGKWIVADPTSTAFGYLTEKHNNHYEQEIGWEVNTTILYNDGRGLILHELELIALTGLIELNKTATIWTSYSIDGETWSQERAINYGKQGERSKRLVWFQNGFIKNWRIQKLRGTSKANISLIRLEAKVEQLYV